MTYHLETITFLSYSGGATPKQLSRYFNRAQSTVDRQIREMISGGLVRIAGQIAANNRKTKFIIPTPRAAALCDRARYASGNISGAYFRKSYLRSEWLCFTGMDIVQTHYDLKRKLIESGEWRFGMTGKTPLLVRDESGYIVGIPALSLETSRLEVSESKSANMATTLLIYDHIASELLRSEPDIFERTMSLGDWIKAMPKMETEERTQIGNILREAKESGKVDSIRVAPIGLIKAFNAGREPVFLESTNEHKKPNNDNKATISRLLEAAKDLL